MIDHPLEYAICSVLGTAVSGVNFFTALDDREHSLPSVTVISKSESLAGSASYFRAEVEIVIRSNAHDTTPEAHDATVKAITAQLEASSTFISSINALGTIELLGFSISGSSQQADDEAFETTFAIRAGVRKLTPSP